MKPISKILLFGALLTGAAAITSCSDDEKYDVDGYSYSRAYFANARNVTNGTVVNTPVGVITSLNTDLIVKSTGAAANDAHVTLGFDNSLVEKYNAANGTKYAAAPDGAVVLSGTTATIKAGKLQSTDTIKATINDQMAAQLNDPNGYLVPVVIASADNGLRPSSDAAVTYIHLTYSESCINDDATALVGTAMDLSQAASEWKLVSSDNFDENTFSNLFSDSPWDRYFAIKEKKEQASCVIDLGKNYNVSGFTVSSNVMSNAYVEISTDQQKWTGLGSTADHKSVDIREGWNSTSWYVLYAGMPARYVRITLTLDQDSYFWGYMDYDWGKSYVSLGGFNISYTE